MMAAAQPLVLRSHFQNRQPARQRGHGRRHLRNLHPGLEAGPESHSRLSRRIQAVSTSLHRRQQDRKLDESDAARNAAAMAMPFIEEANLNAPPRAVRHKLKEERMSVTHKFNIGGHEGYIIVGLYPDGDPGEIFIKMAKEGSTVSGLMDSFALAVVISLQHGVPLKLFCEKFAHTRFEPSGWSSNPDIGFAKSIMDYIFRWLQLRFMTGQQQFLFENLRPKTQASPEVVSDLNGSLGLSPTTTDQRPPTGSIHAADALAGMIDMGDAPSCSFCGAIMTRNGSCYRCGECGSTSGCS